MENKFDWQGYSADKLESLCQKPTVRTQKSSKYWPTSTYSAGVYLRKYTNYPSFLPLICYCGHGINAHSTIGNHELVNDAPFILYFTDQYVKKYPTLSTKPVYKIPAPFPWLRRNYGIEKSNNAKGTLAFYSHTTNELELVGDAKNNIDTYIDALLSLPEKMLPICVCLHMHDIHKGAHKYFIERNIPVYTAGNAHSEDFALHFYSILKNFKYSTSSSIGSNVWYSIEMGIPFFLHGDFKDFYLNTSDAQTQPKIVTTYKTEEWHYAQQIFASFSETITPEQKEFTQKLMNEDDCLQPNELLILLYKAYIKYLLLDTPKKFLKRLRQSIIKRITR